jgi:hypothetical protein
MSGEAKQRLAAAHANVASAKQSLADVTRASQSARNFLAEMNADVRRCLEAEHVSLAERAADLKTAFKSGSAPKVGEMTGEARAARIDAETRQSAAQQAMSEMTAEERTATTALAAADAELKAAAKAVVIDEAEAHAAKATALEAEAMQHRIEVAGLLRVDVSAELSAIARRVAAENDETKIAIFNEAEWLLANQAGERWRTRVSELLNSIAEA